MKGDGQDDIDPDAAADDGQRGHTRTAKLSDASVATCRFPNGRYERKTT
jgi:hypothetical protein